MGDRHSIAVVRSDTCRPLDLANRLCCSRMIVVDYIDGLTVVPWTVTGLPYVQSQ